MNRLRGLVRMWSETVSLGLEGRFVGPVVLLLIFLAAMRPASAQVVPAGDAGGLNVSAGATASGYYVQYGQVKLLGVAGFVDVDTRRHIGIEGEARFLEFHQTADIHAETYVGGPRYRFNIGRFQPYVKGMVGVGEFNFPYDYAHGSYLVIAPGGGVDYRLTRRIHLRLADFEYQYWPQFTYGAMSSVGVSTGFRVRIF